MIATGLDRILERPETLRGRRYGLLAHAASVSASLVPAHLALAAAGVAPVALFGPEHGFYGVEQDMVPAADRRDPWTGLPIVSLYGADARSLKPRREAFAGLDLVLIDLQDVGSRYYTYAATAVWTAEAAIAAGVEAWILDRPNPLGGEAIEGNLPTAGFESFVGAFRVPVRHGLTLGEIVRLEGRRRGWSDGCSIVALRGWRREQIWSDLGRPWIAPSPNMPSPATAAVYPGLCLLEATEVSEGRGTTRPFLLAGAPWIDPPRLARELAALGHAEVAFVPAYFRPQFQKHRGEICGGVEIVVRDPRHLAAYRLGVELLAVLATHAPEKFAWRAAPYEFVADRPAIDLLAGCETPRRELADPAALASWIAGWSRDEAEFREERRASLLYPEERA
ncbi:MAG: DUF1343 domain-containing protein [Thermoanaerobaculia bacterium]